MIIIIILVPLNLLLSGCVHQNGTAKPNPIFANQYLKKGKMLERKGHLTEALEQYKLALAVDQKNALAALRIKKLTRNVTILANKHFKLGTKYNSQKKYGLASKELLTALKYRPNHQKAYKLLITMQPTGLHNYATYIFQKERKTAATAPVVKPNKSDEKKPQPAQPFTDPPPLSELKGETQTFAYRDTGIQFYNNKKYKEAIFELNKAVAATPDDHLTRAYLAKAHFQNAQIDYNKGDFLAAKIGFESALEYNSQCERCAAEIIKSLESYKETHYNKGVVYYAKQQLVQAINEWEMVHELDPGYKDVEQKLHKARTLLKKLKKIKKSQQS
jgi:tetratricopeptide (TPR) repeat protein